MDWPEAFRDRLAQVLDPPTASPLKEEVPAGTSLAAVLVPVLTASPEPRVVFTRRTDTLSRHPGEISFPGGLAGEGEDLPTAALREAGEELGLLPSDVELVGALPPVHTRITGILIAPFVGLLHADPRFTPNAAEIADVLEFPLASLAEAGAEKEFERDGVTFQTFVYDMDGQVIWGATARILHSFLELLGSRDGGDMNGTAEPRPELEPYEPSDKELRAILGRARTIAVVGLSSKSHRPSFEVASYLQKKGYRVIPVNPNETEVLGEKAYPSLLDVPETIDVVDVFRRAEHTPDVARQAVRAGAKVLWLQAGIVNEEARRIAEQGGLEVVMGVCMMTTHMRVRPETKGSKGA